MSVLCVSAGVYVCECVLYMSARVCMLCVCVLIYILSS